jgi:hypothetical protein
LVRDKTVAADQGALTQATEEGDCWFGDAKHGSRTVCPRKHRYASLAVTAAAALQQ